MNRACALSNRAQCTFASRTPVDRRKSGARAPRSIQDWGSREEVWDQSRRMVCWTRNGVTVSDVGASAGKCGGGGSGAVKREARANRGGGASRESGVVTETGWFVHASGPSEPHGLCCAPTGASGHAPWQHACMARPVGTSAPQAFPFVVSATATKSPSTVRRRPADLTIPRLLGRPAESTELPLPQAGSSNREGGQRDGSLLGSHATRAIRRTRPWAAGASSLVQVH
jgi:hypothetical protein